MANIKTPVDECNVITGLDIFFLIFIFKF